MSVAAHGFATVLLWAARSTDGSRLPAHAVNRFAGDRIFAGAADDELLLAVKVYCARIVRVDVEIESLWRDAFCFGNERRADARTPMLRRHHDLIEIERFGIDRDEADH